MPGTTAPGTTPSQPGNISGAGMQGGAGQGMPPYLYGTMPSGPMSAPQYMAPGMEPEMNIGMGMPFTNYPAYQGIPNMYLPNMNPYGAPMGVPLFPLYGYDNSAELDRDVEYMKQLYPNTAKAIQAEIDNECDQMEYDGSMMFDEYPDRVYFDRIVDRIYDRVKDMDEEAQVEAESLYFFPPVRRHDHLRDLVAIILLNEIFHRRRRHRSRRRWF
jgi:hypothetical protein